MAAEGVTSLMPIDIPKFEIHLEVNLLSLNMHSAEISFE